jgi:hypothetical protein
MRSYGLNQLLARVTYEDNESERNADAGNARDPVCPNRH